MTRIPRIRLAIVLVALVHIFSCTTPSQRGVITEAPRTVSTQDAAELYGELFVRVQTTPVFADSKHFVDMIPRANAHDIMAAYEREQPLGRERLLQFVNAHFRPPADPVSNFRARTGETIDAHIGRLWTYLRREASEEAQPTSSLISLPFSYVVPGGRFREIYYWDSYFTQLGLLADGQDVVFQNMVKNFEHLIQTMGRIPNGNRDYYRGRSQPPFFAYMVELWQRRYGMTSALRFLPALESEYRFWMTGDRAIALAPNRILNRYWDDKAAPRPEAYKEDINLAAKAATMLRRSPNDVYRDLRAAAESGWDYSERWFADPNEFASIQTTSLLPVDLNAIIYHLEVKLAEYSRAAGREDAARRYEDASAHRKLLMQTILWDEKAGVFLDYNWRLKQRSPIATVATVVPLFAGVATPAQARRVAKVLERDFLKPGGLVTSLNVTGQQWDAPNGWPPHQWMAYNGLKDYDQTGLAEQIRSRWMKLNERVFLATGKMMEKYNVIDLTLETGGGEYPLQDGFGWTNGVYRAFKAPGALIERNAAATDPRPLPTPPLPAMAPGRPPTKAAAN